MTLPLHMDSNRGEEALEVGQNQQSLGHLQGLSNTKWYGNRAQREVVKWGLGSGDYCPCEVAGHSPPRECLSL